MEKLEIFGEEEDTIKRANEGDGADTTHVYAENQITENDWMIPCEILSKLPYCHLGKRKAPEIVGVEAYSNHKATGKRVKLEINGRRSLKVAELPA